MLSFKLSALPRFFLTVTIKREQDQLSLLAGILASMCLTTVLKGFDGRKPFVSSEVYDPRCGKPFECNDIRGQRLERRKGFLLSK